MTTFADPGNEADIETSARITQAMYNDNNDGFFSGIGCFKDTFSLHVKEIVKPYQAPP